MTVETINLAVLGDSTTPRMGGLSSGTEIIPGSLGWGSAVVEMEYSFDYLYTAGENTGGTWHSMTPPVKFGSSRPARYGIPVPPASWVRLKVVTADGTADTNADYVHVPAAAVIGGTPKILGQSRPSSTTAASLYSPGAGVRTEIGGITACNVSGATATLRIFLDIDGSTYDQSTALYYDVKVAADTTFSAEPVHPWVLDDPSGNLGIKTNVASAFNFTAWGVEL